MADTDESLTFLTSLAALASRLAADGIVIESVSYQTQGFGGWQLEAARRRIRIRVTWDGKDRHLSVAIAELATGSKERRWQLAEEHDFRGRRTDLAQLFGTLHAAITAHAGV